MLSQEKNKKLTLVVCFDQIIFNFRIWIFLEEEIFLEEFEHVYPIHRWKKEKNRHRKYVRVFEEEMRSKYEIEILLKISTSERKRNCQ
jgi:hypothetical protein